MVIGEFITTNPIFHSPDCPCLQKLDPNNLMYFNNQKEARVCGYTHCNECSRMYTLYKNAKREIQNYSRENNMSVKFFDDSIYITHIDSYWKIVIDNTLFGLTLYHGNREQPKFPEVKDGVAQYKYHLQNYKGEKEILAMLLYIVDHDEWKQTHPEAKTPSKKKCHKQSRRHTKKIKSNKKE